MTHKDRARLERRIIDLAYAAANAEIDGDDDERSISLDDLEVAVSELAGVLESG